MYNSTKTKIPKGWQIKKLGEIGRISMCKRIFKNETLPSGPVPFYKISTFGKKADSYISNDLFEKYKNKYPYPKHGEVLISASGTIGRIVVFDGKKSYFQDSNIVWISNTEDRAINKFLKFVYLSTKWKSTDGGIISRLYNDDLRSVHFLLPPLDEQNRIVAVLETWDKAVNRLAKKIDIKKKIKKGLMQKLLTGKLRLSGFNEKWQIVKLGDICDIKKGKDLSKEKLIDNGKNKCILYGELYTRYKEIITDVISRTNYDEGIRSVSGDILIPASTTTNAMDLAIATCLSVKDVLLAGDINILRQKKKYNSNFFALYLTYTKKHNLARLAQGITIVHLYGKDCKDLKLELPSIEEQSAIADIIISANKEIEALEQILKNYKNQKTYLLNNLITGAIRTPETMKINS